MGDWIGWADTATSRTTWGSHPGNGRNLRQRIWEPSSMKRVKWFPYTVVALICVLCCGACAPHHADKDVNEIHILQSLLGSSESYNNLYVTKLVISDTSVAADMRQKKWVLSGYLESRAEFKRLCEDLTKHQLFHKVALSVDIQAPSKVGGLSEAGTGNNPPDAD